jgi:hypothetical protein
MSKTNPFAALLPQLKAKGVHTVKVEYSGSGDGGSVDEVICACKDIEEPIEIGEELHGLLIDAANQLIDEKHAGWENNDGGFGTMKLDVSTGEFEWVHNENYTASDTNTYTATLK